MSYLTTEANLNVLAQHMDDDKREQVYGTTDDPSEFLNAYLALGDDEMDELLQPGKQFYGLATWVED